MARFLAVVLTGLVYLFSLVILGVSMLAATFAIAGPQGSEVPEGPALAFWVAGLIVLLVMPVWFARRMWKRLSRAVES